MADGQLAELILPEEVWSTIVTQSCMYGSYLLSCRATCTLFYRLCNDYKCAWLFGIVLPLVFPYIPICDLLTSRLVCKLWNLAVCKLLLQQQSNFLCRGTKCVGFTITSNRVVFTRIFLPDILPALPLNKWQHTFLNISSNVNPFPSRTLHMRATEMNAEILQFFHNFGKHLHYLNLYIRQDHQSQKKCKPPLRILEVTRFLWRLLRTVPNLQGLKLHSDNVFPPWKPSEEKEPKLLAFLQRYPVPRLKNLKVLQLNVNVPVTAKKLEMAYIPQVSLYKQSYFQLQYITDDGSWKKQLQNLRHLSLEFWETSIGDSVPKLPYLSSLNCSQLKELTLNFCGSDIQTSNDLRPREVFLQVENYSEKLECLILKWSLMEWPFPKSVNLPYLQYLRMELYNVRINTNFSFLKGLKRLCKIELALKLDCALELLQVPSNQQKDHNTNPSILLTALVCPEDIREGRIVSNKVYTSDLWGLVPSLELLQIEYLTQGNFYGLCHKISMRFRKLRYERKHKDLNRS